ncbi:MAG: FHA domain-containing protein [Coriobacteriales bacterium]|jgi:hypothetical protein|nr:FHA domain-containing protein [Coriobacteriales bacterium]
MMIKTCPHCASTAFEDMTVCYGCLQPFDVAASLSTILPAPGIGVVSSRPLGGINPTTSVALPLPVAIGGDEEEFSVEEPSGVVSPSAVKPVSIRFHVTVSDLFGYDVYLSREEGAQLTIGCARDNNIVLPHIESRRHVLRLYYAQGFVWAEDQGSTQQALVEGVPLAGARRMKRGTALEVGKARIELIED